MKIGVIGAGISGIATAHILTKCGHQVTVYEKSSELGGVWALGYPGVKLQNTREHYHISDVPWPFVPDKHPTSGQVREYIQHVIGVLDLDVQLSHEVTAISDNDSGWSLTYENHQGQSTEQFDYLVVSIGQYTEGKSKPKFAGQEKFAGEILTERDVTNLDVFDDKRVAVVGFGKSAVDMATFAVQRAKQVSHVFRTPRWLIPFHIFGVHYATLLFCRAGTAIMPSWAHPTRAERFLHKQLNLLVRIIWKFLSSVFKFLCLFHGVGKGKESRERLREVLPEHGFVEDFRSATAMAPKAYFPSVANGNILPYHAEVSGFSETGLRLKDGRQVECDQVLLCVGSETPTYPFFEKKYRDILETESDGVQLYRHLLHPKIPKLAFAGFNHGFMHVPAVEVAMVWLSAYLDGDIELPSNEAMQKSIDQVLSWKRQYIHFEPSRSCAVNTRFQQYLDIMLKDLGLSPYRKMPNIFAEIFSQYGANDYQNVLSDYQESRSKCKFPISPLSLDT